ncbi:hypothetical protein [Pseudidiomarina terrestris]|uniref:MSHA biogenesis protein MshJ n=1 Tax=Pseudidiomarina terrestris TaxID=2820060 RepID=A0AAW7QVI6_9GAMM|nr:MULTISPECIES: hypothetical protein [unclassified Pseudidiomarina]MDN7124265.1 hypothetical protein [Pseudidiomarina sp. 1APP75-32.1]MDN7126266.1 hypothetical protein [Pseudidiomarina sp. 1APR75-33.1]MDN7129444.1 hypothetical protein [Pseudidiomarina sp. 1APR75-15]MDN7134291.1 hypothetical protein [Pseudidiomarina sp. 1ASP75-5]MDN7137021.1 hypothetical protein [Pseudidiomarina sp. 1ASP75-14]
MKARWQQLQLKFNELPLSRRKFWFVLTLIFIAYLGLWVALLPTWQTYKTEQTKLKQQQSRVELLQQQLQAVEIRLAGDPQAPLRTKLSELEQRLAQLNSRLRAETNYVSAADNRQLLKALLGSAGALEVQSAQALPAERVYGDGEATAGAIYKHRLQLILRGDYNEIYRYFLKLEQLPWSFYWQRMDYEVKEHPDATLLLEIYTLSLERDYVAS